MTLYLEEKLLRRKKQGNLRQLQVVKNLIDFASNDYLGLAKSPLLATKVAQKVALFLKTDELGSTGSRLLTGNSEYAQNLESTIATYHGYEAGVLFNCGYMANVGLLPSIMDNKDSVFFDSSIHTSMRDGMRLSGAKAFSFRHQDVEHLEKRLKKSLISRNRFICIQSIYSTDGSKSPLKEICQIAKKYGAQLIVDEAHAVGVYGPNGRGLISEQNLCSEVFALVITFGKALGTHGAMVLGNHTLKQALINFAHSYIYTTALPFYSLAAIQSAYELLPSLESERKQLNQLVQLFQKTQANASETHIQPIFIEGNENAKHLSQTLSYQGYDVRALLSPTVQKGKEILRLCLHAFNQKEDLRNLLKHIKSYRSRCDA